MLFSLKTKVYSHLKDLQLILTGDAANLIVLMIPELK